MPGSSNTLLIEGSFSELADELAQFIDGVQKPEEGSGVHADVKPVLDEIQQIEQAEDPQSVDQAKLEELKNDALKKIVTKASALNNAPEKGEDRSVCGLKTY
jgi:translation initiation factor 3 subunit M